MARGDAAVGAGLTLGSEDRVAADVGSTDGVGVASAVGAADGLGPGVRRGEAGTSEVIGVAVGDAVFVGRADGRVDGVAVGSAVGRETTSTASPPAASVPTTTAWFRTGDWEIDFGRMPISTRLALPSDTLAQSGWRSAGQTASTAVTLYARAPSADVPIQPTSPAPTVSGVGPGVGPELAMARGGAVSTGAMAVVSSEEAAGHDARADDDGDDRHTGQDAKRRPWDVPPGGRPSGGPTTGGRCAFDGDRCPGPQVARRLRAMVSQAAQGGAVRLVGPGDRVADGAVDEVLIEPGSVCGRERSVQTFSGQAASALVGRSGIARPPPADALHAAHR